MYLVLWQIKFWIKVIILLDLPHCATLKNSSEHSREIQVNTIPPWIFAFWLCKSKTALQPNSYYYTTKPVVATFFSFPDIQVRTSDYFRIRKAAQKNSCWNKKTSLIFFFDRFFNTCFFFS